MTRVITRFKRRLRAIFRGEAVDHELRDEIRLHLDLEAEELMRLEGLQREEAWRRARIAFGNVGQVRDQHRDARGIRWIERRIQDTRYAIRGLRSHPGFAIAVVLTLALGIGANAAMFSIVDRLLFRAPPLMHDASRVHRVYMATSYQGTEYQNSGTSYARFADIARGIHSFDRIAAFTEPDLAVGTGVDAREMKVAAVSAEFFQFFDAPPAFGRYFTSHEETPATPAAVVVLSYALWQSRFGGRDDVAGHAIQIGATRYIIIGVAPRGFTGLWPDTPPVAYIPITAYGAEDRARFEARGLQWWTAYSWTWLQVMVERTAGVAIARANADLSQAFVRSYENELVVGSRRAPVAVAKPHAVAASILSDRGPNESSLAKVATWIGGVALIVWLIACANVANLLLARALQRRREIAVRLALGVSRARLAAQLLTESLILALLGGVSGLAIAQWGGALLRSAFLSPTSTATVVTDPRALIYAGVAALVAGLLTGLAPLLQTRHLNLSRDLKEGVREGTYQRSALRSGLLIAQGMLSVMLLVGAGLFVRSLRHVRAVPLGFQPEQVLEIERNMRGMTVDSTRGIALMHQLLAAADAIPGVTSAARQLTVPFTSEWSQGLSVPGVDSVNTLGSFELNAVSPSYFTTMGTRILTGRGIEAQDRFGAPAAMVVSQAMAKAIWPAGGALGKCVRIGDDTMPCHYVVGIAENIKADQLADDPGLYYYLSAEQFHPEQGGLFLKVQGDPDVVKESVRKALQRLMPGESYVTVTPLRDAVGGQTQTWQLGASMFVIFGVLALVLAAIGLYSVIAFNVGQRLHELGVRVALGASGRDIVTHVLTGGLKLAFAGMVLGLAASLVASRWVKPLLFEESPHDPAVFALVAAVLLTVAALASFIPARRASRVDPMRALRSD